MEISRNVTEQDHHASVHRPASGWSIFWALLAIVSNAMLQPSFTGYLFHGNAFAGSLWPHRSSPFVCLVDAVADIYMSLQAMKRHAVGHANDGSLPRRNGTLSRIALFGLGVVPQAIKLFSMQGIAVTQAIAAMFLLSSTVSLLRSLTVDDPESDAQILLQDLGEIGFLKIGTVMFGWLPHAIAVYLLWYGLVDQIGISAPPNIRNAVLWVTVTYNTLYLLCFFQHIIFGLFRRKPLIYVHPIAVVIGTTHCCCIEDLVGVPGERMHHGLRGRGVFTAEILATLSFACYVGVVALDYVVDSMYKRCKRCGNSHWRILKMRCTATDSSSLPSSADTAIPEEPSISEAPEFPVVGSTAWRRPLLTHMKNRLTILKNLSSPVQDDPDGVHASSPQARLDHTATDANNNGASPPVVNVDGDDDTYPAPPTSNDPELRAADADKPVSFPLRLLGLFLWHIVIAPPNLLYSLYAFEDERGFRAAERRITAREQRQHSGTTDRGTSTTLDQLHVESPALAATATSTTLPAVDAPHTSLDHHRHQGTSAKLKRRLQSGCYTLGNTVYAALRQTAKLLVRSFMAIATLELYAGEWVEWRVRRYYPPKLLVVAFGFVNFVTAVVCYLVLFDGKGTVAPGWAYVFG